MRWRQYLSECIRTRCLKSLALLADCSWFGCSSFEVSVAGLPPPPQAASREEEQHVEHQAAASFHKDSLWFAVFDKSVWR